MSETRPDSRKIKKRIALTRLGISADSSVEEILDTIDEEIILASGSVTNNSLVRFDGSTGKLVKNSATTLSDTGNLSVTSSTFPSVHIARTTTGTNTTLGVMAID